MLKQAPSWNIYRVPPYSQPSQRGAGMNLSQLIQTLSLIDSLWMLPLLFYITTWDSVAYT
jgi:hypothetical protein